MTTLALSFTVSILRIHFNDPAKEYFFVGLQGLEKLKSKHLSLSSIDEATIYVVFEHISFLYNLFRDNFFFDRSLKTTKFIVLVGLCEVIFSPFNEWTLPLILDNDFGLFQIFIYRYSSSCLAV